jgi:hypothetical protein
MKHIVMVGSLIVGGLAVFAVADSLSSDALGMALGMVFGICAGIPAALIVMAAQRGPGLREADRPVQRGGMPPMPQFPVIVVSGGQQPALAGQSSAPFWNLDDLQARQSGYGNARQFRVVGDQDELVDEW